MKKTKEYLDDMGKAVLEMRKRNKARKLKRMEDYNSITNKKRRKQKQNVGRKKE